MKSTIYHLHYDAEKFAIVILINEKAVPFLSGITPNNNVIKMLMKYFNFYPPNLFDFDQVNLSFTEKFGFNDASINSGIKDGFLEFVIPIPAQTLVKNEPCRECNGSGKNYLGERKCFSCNGTKLNRISNTLSVRSTVATLYLLLRYLDFTFSNFSEKNEKNKIKIPQDILLSISMESGQCKGGVAGGFSSEIDEKSKKLFQDLKIKEPYNFSEKAIGGPLVYLEKVHNDMVSFYGHMYGRPVSESESRCEFNASIKEDGRIYLQTIGVNGCSVYHERSGFGNMLDGLTLTCHNIDYYLQELTLLVGVISYYQMVSEI